MNRIYGRKAGGMASVLAKRLSQIFILIALVSFTSVVALADEHGGDSVWTTDVAVDTLWVLIASMLVFFMNAGFGCVEAGFCRAKNAVNILGKNFVVFGISSIAFWIIGWAIMFGEGNSFMGTTGWFIAGADNSPVTGDAYNGVYDSIAWRYNIYRDSRRCRNGIKSS